MNENLDTELDEELDEFGEETDADTDSADLDLDLDDEDEDETTASDDDELEYDEDGNVIVEKSDETDAETQDEDAAQTATAEEDKKTDTDYDKLKKRYDDREALIKDALKKMGIEEDDVEQALIRLGADAEGISPEEYAKQREEAKRKEAAERLYAEVLLEKKIAEDLAILHAEFPETKDITKLEQIPNARRFAELRDIGVSAREAYVAANIDAHRDRIAKSVRQQSINATKSHLVSNVPIASKDTSVKISRSDMEQLRDLFPNKSDKEIIALYKKTK